MKHENSISIQLIDIFAACRTLVKFDQTPLMKRKGAYLGLNCDGSKLAYIPVSRLNRFDSPNDLWDPDKRKRFAVQSTVRRCLSACGINLIEEEIKRIEYHFNVPKLTISEISNNISEVYNHSKNNLSGSLGDSCMQGQPKEFFEFYDEEPNCQLIVARLVNGQLAGRALLWHSGTHKFCDRRYGLNSYVEEAIERYALNQGYYIKQNNNFDPVKYWCSNTYELPPGQAIELTNQIDSYEHYPFMDTFKWRNDNRLYDFEHDDTYEMTNTDGRGSMSICDICEERYDALNGGDNELCEDCFSKYRFFCDDCGEIRHIDDKNHIIGTDSVACDHCAEKYYKHCDECYNYVGDNHYRYFSRCGTILCEECLS